MCDSFRYMMIEHWCSSQWQLIQVSMNSLVYLRSSILHLQWWMCSSRLFSIQIGANLKHQHMRKGSRHVHVSFGQLYIYGGFLKWWYPTTMGFPTKTDHFGVFWGYHHSRKHPYMIYIAKKIKQIKQTRPPSFLRVTSGKVSWPSIELLYPTIWSTTRIMCKSYAYIDSMIWYDLCILLPQVSRLKSYKYNCYSLIYKKYIYIYIIFPWSFPGVFTHLLFIWFPLTWWDGQTV